MPPVHSLHSGDLPRRIRALMADQAITVSALARNLGWERTRVHRRIHGWTPITIDELIKLADALHVPVSELLAERAA